ncbi:uncharacterized protein [Aristolochia californica]|uniref:uncharacterized protein n=1 Tax=Aristolochia californica TaxID=171875 RepID=UPI0035D53260
MGSICCVAARDRILPNRTHIDALQRNIRYSPSLSIQWDNSAYVEDGLDSQTSLAVENARTAETESFLDRGSLTETFQISGRGGVVGTDMSLENNHYAVEDPRQSLSAIEPSDQSPTASLVPATSSSSIKASPLPSHCRSFPSEPTPSRHSRLFPEYQISWRKSDNRVPVKSSHDISASEGRESFSVPVSSNDIEMGSHGGSSDGWSMRMFSELVASQRETWSVRSENTSHGHGKFSSSDSQLLLSSPSSTDSRACGICSELLLTDYLVVAVLVCGHVYHAECLEYVTPETNKFDPSCPICTTGGKPFKIFGKVPNINRNNVRKWNLCLHRFSRKMFSYRRLFLRV